MKPIPKFHETFIPILAILKDRNPVDLITLRKRVKAEFYPFLTPEQLLEKTGSGANLIDSRINWGKSYLKAAGYVQQPQRGVVTITNKGLEALKLGTLDLETVQKEAGFQEKRQPRLTSEYIESEGTTKSLTPLDTATPQDRIDSGILQIETQVKKELLEKLSTIDPYYFEQVVLTLLNKMGYGDLVTTPKSGDGGIDGIINQDKLGVEKIYLQVKRFNGHNVRELDIRNFIGAMSGDTTKGVFVTTSSFDPAAVRKAQASHHTIILVDGKRLVDLMYEYGVGVQVAHTYIVKTLDEDYFEEG